MAKENRNHILVLDDEPGTLSLLEGILKSAGYRVTAVENGTRALAAARSDRPDLAVLDLLVPGLDGFQLVSMLKRDRELAMPVIVVSGRMREADREAACKAGADLFLPKPVDRERLVAEVARLLAAGKQS